MFASDRWVFSALGGGDPFFDKIRAVFGTIRLVFYKRS